MKILLFTIWHVRNYGAEMQAYATVRALKMLGHEVEVANIYLSDGQKRNFNGRIGDVIRSISPGGRKFTLFWNQQIPKSKRYRNVKDIFSNPPEADLYLVGSDQVWNPEITGSFSDLFFLPFENVKKVSYASSIGSSEWLFPKERDNEIKEMLNDFNALSCREETGSRLLNNFLGKPVNSVIDPTLLFNDYHELIGDVHHKDYIAYYPLSEDGEQFDCAKKLSSIMGIPAVDITQKKYLYKKLVWDQASILDWIRGIAESRFVLTPSFHGLAFSLIYKREFAILVDPSRGSRILDLLDIVGLSDRAFTSVESFLKSEIWNMPIDYSRVGSILNNYRKESLKFLVENII